eukprot:g22283.t1
MPGDSFVKPHPRNAFGFPTIFGSAPFWLPAMKLISQLQPFGTGRWPRDLAGKGDGQWKEKTETQGFHESRTTPGRFYYINVLTGHSDLPVEEVDPPAPDAADYRDCAFADGVTHEDELPAPRKLSTASVLSCTHGSRGVRKLSVTDAWVPPSEPLVEDTPEARPVYGQESAEEAVPAQAEEAAVQAEEESVPSAQAVSVQAEEESVLSAQAEKEESGPCSHLPTLKKAPFESQSNTHLSLVQRKCASDVSKLVAESQCPP